MLMGVVVCTMMVCGDDSEGIHFSMNDLKKWTTATRCEHVYFYRMDAKLNVCTSMDGCSLVYFKSLPFQNCEAREQILS